MAEREKEQALVVSQECLADGIFSMWIQTKAAKTAKAGQFISMYTNDGSKLLPRPISICEIDREGGKLRVVYRVTGEKTGTEQFSKMKAGDTIPVIGALGNGFPLIEKKAFVIGGGIAGAGEIILRIVQKYYRPDVLPAGADIPFELARLGNDAGMYGSMKLLLDTSEEK